MACMGAAIAAWVAVRPMTGYWELTLSNAPVVVLLLSIRLGKVESGISTQKMSARDFWRFNHHSHGTGVLNSLLDCNRKYLHL